MENWVLLCSQLTDVLNLVAAFSNSQSHIFILNSREFSVCQQETKGQ